MQPGEGRLRGCLPRLLCAGETACGRGCYSIVTLLVAKWAQPRTARRMTGRAHLVGASTEVTQKRLEAHMP